MSDGLTGPVAAPPAGADLSDDDRLLLGLERDPDHGITVYQVLARMPLIDRLELSAIYGISSTTSHRYLELMEKRGYVKWLDYATRYLRSSRRYYLTWRGLELVRSIEGGKLPPVYLVTRAWRRAFAQRMDAIASIYRFASSLAVEVGMAPVHVNNCLRGPWDAFIEFPNGVVLGVMRQGCAMSRYSLRDRFWRMSGREGGMPALTFVLASDSFERKEAIKRLRYYPEMPALVVSEYEVLDAGRAGERWALPSHDGGRFSMVEIARTISETKSDVLDFSEYWRWSSSDREMLFEDGEEILESSPSFRMTGAEKRLMDLVYEWPLATRSVFMSMLDVSPSRLTKIAGSLMDMDLIGVERTGASAKKRYALTDTGIAYMCRRDRVEIKAKLNTMSVSKRANGGFRGGTMRVIEKEINHNDGLNGFLERLWSDRRGSWRKLVAVPTTRSKRRFEYEGSVRYITPDMVLEMMSSDGRTLTALVEYERRARFPSWMSKKVAPYRRYFDSSVIYDDCDGRPVVLFIFESLEQETVFVRSVLRDRKRTGVDVPFFSTVGERIRVDGPLGRVWRVAFDASASRLISLEDMALYVDLR